MEIKSGKDRREESVTGADVDTGAYPKSFEVSAKSRLSQPEIAVIGAGLSGLETTRILHECGHKVTTYDARDRLGGRILTVQGPSGEIAELGGTFVSPWDTYIRSLCSRLDIELVDDAVARPHAVREFELGSHRFSGSAFLELIAPLVAQIKIDKAAIKSEISIDRPNAHHNGPHSRALDSISASQYLDRVKGLDPIARALVENRLCNELGREATELSATTLVFLGLEESEVDSGSVFRVKGGSSEIVSRLALPIESRLELDMCLTRARHTSSGQIELSFEGSKALVVDAVVFSLPFSVLRNVDLSGLQISDDTKRAISETAYATHSKNVVFGVDCEHWQKNGIRYEVDFREGGMIWEEAPSRKGPGALTYFAGGNQGRELSDIRSITENVMRHVSGRFPEIGHRFPSQHLLMNWSQDRFAGGSYAADLVGHTTSLRGLIRSSTEAERRIHFAGEAIGYGGVRNFMNAALGSGAEAATSVGKRHGLKIVGRADREEEPE